MLAKFKNFIGRHDLLEPGDRVLLAVSGGLDSMVMLSLFQEAGYRIGVAHCNFQLRDKESEEDELWVKKHCAQFKLTFFSQRFETKNYAEKTRLSIQMAARELRYTWFSQVMETEKFHWLATAHHLDDNVETILLRWTKGAGLDQLTGIPLKKDKVIRPLLFATRAEIADYAAARKIVWREDSSNAKDDYQRNFIRHQVVPRLKEINPALEETFAHSQQKLLGAYEMMQRGIGQLKDSITRTEGNQLLIDKNLLMLLNQPVFVCYEWLRPLGFEWDRCLQLVEALAAQSGKQFSSATHQAVIDREFVIVSPINESMNEVLIEEGQDKAAIGPWRLILQSSKGNKITQSPGRATFDGSKVKFPVLWRKWRNGDYFFPLGLGHRKKVSDFLIDEKIPITDKGAVTVVESGGEIVWVVGHRVDDRFKVTPGTTVVLQMQVDHI